MHFETQAAMFIKASKFNVIISEIQLFFDCSFFKLKKSSILTSIFLSYVSLLILFTAPFLTVSSSAFIVDS